ncbi:PAS domain S-box protein [Pareuzebyella sediminis]|uniref:PAS domain S-box protein n=1 Tax=Pareuzebyella sediminis TaxID=2607998 RepID=UPI0011EC82FA|nr:PAS domain S-box protein [Pareuzebyella sediminis]
MQTLSIDLILKDSPSALAILDENLKFLRYSDKWLKQFGGRHHELIGKNFFEVLSEIPEALNQALKKALCGKAQFNEACKFIRIDGQIQYFKWHIKAWKDEEDTIGGVTILLEDVTAEYIEKELLFKAEKVSRTGSWEVDLLGNKIYWSPQTKEIHEVAHDFEPNLETGINFYKKGKHRDTITELITEAISEGTPWDTELILVTAKGKELWVRAKGEAEFIGGKCVRLFGTFQDIDKKKKRELAYNKVSQRLEIATKGANIGIWDYDISLNNLVWDEHMYRLYGIKEDDFNKEYDAWCSALHPDDRKRAEEELEMAISGSKEFNTEFRIIWPNGEIRRIKAAGSIQRDSEGKALKIIGTNWDITELKTTQLKLKKSEESFQGAFENSNIGMALVGLQGQWIEVNQSLCKSLGYTKSELMQTTFQDLTHPEDLDKDLALLAKVIEGQQESYQIEKRYLHKNGDIVYAILTVTAVNNIEGELSHFISQVMDISQRIETELKYKEVSERLNVATRVANIGVWDYRLEDKSVVCNDNMYKMYQIPRNVANAMDGWTNRIHIDDIDNVRHELQKTISGEKPFNTQFRGIKSNGEIIHIMAFGEAQYDIHGKVSNIIGANFDITELVNTQKELLQSEESLNAAFEHSNIGMAIKNLDGRWVRVNDSLCRSLGYTSEELLSFSYRDITHKEDVDKEIELHFELISGKRKSYQMQKRYYHKKGYPVHVILTVTAVRNENGQTTRFISQVLDINTRIEAEKSLNELVEVTRSQNDSLMNFAHIVSHNLRSHSSNLSMLTGFLKDEKDEEEKEGLANMLVDASESLNETVVHLNEVVQVKVGVAERLKRVNLLKTISGVEKNLSLLLQEKNTTCYIDIPKDLFVFAIPAYLDSIFLNLFTNSIKYSSPGRSPEIRIGIERRNNFVVLTFADNGLGIDLNRHGDKLFGMYKTFHRNKDAKGIGLFITRNQIEAMNGKIEVESEVNIGTTFRLYFKEQ